MRNMMIRAIASLLSLLHTLSLTPYDEKATVSRILSGDQPYAYSYVAIIGVDGAGAFFNRTDTPNMDRIFADGAVTYTGQAEVPSISAQNWGSILYGVECGVHGFTNAKAEKTPVTSRFPYPSLFRIARQAEEDALLCASVTWEPIVHGIIESDLGVDEFQNDRDADVVEHVIETIRTAPPKLLFVQIDWCDSLGHTKGYGSEEQLAYLTEVDGHIDRIYRAYEERGILDETLFIVCADHGGTYIVNSDGTVKGTHGKASPEETTVFIGITGKTVAHRDPGNIRNRDVAAIAAAALGLEIPEVWTARVPDALFTDRLPEDLRDDLEEAQERWELTGSPAEE